MSVIDTDLDHLRDLGDAVEGILADAESRTAQGLGPADGVLARQAWRALDAAGFTAIGSPADQGGEGGGIEEAAVVVRRVAAAAASLPLDLALVVAPCVRSRAGLPYRPGIVAVALASHSQVSVSGSELSLDLPSVPWAEEADSLLVLAPVAEGVAIVEIPRDGYTAEPAPGDGLDPAASVRVANVNLPVLQPGALLDETALLVDLATTLKIVGSLESVLTMTTSYVQERHQFGKPLATFQSVRQQLALLASEVVVASVAADSVVQQATAGRLSSIAVRSARLRAAQAATAVSSIAHQLHGAIGFTREYPLHLHTRRLWAWRDEHTTEATGRSLLGAELLRTDLPDSRLWARITEKGLGQ